MMPRSRSYQEDLLVALREPSEAQEYLKVALEDDNPEVFLLALKDVIETNSYQGRSIARERHAKGLKYWNDLNATTGKVLSEG